MAKKVMNLIHERTGVKYHEVHIYRLLHKWGFSSKVPRVCGNDLHSGEHKFKKPFYFRNHAKLFFSCNKIPETDDDTDAFFRRIFIINFTQQFFGEKNDPHLIDKISTGDQLSILLSERGYHA